MMSRFRCKPFRGRTVLLTTCLSIAGVVTLCGASKSRAITKLSVDPTADVVPLFDGIDQKSLEVSYIPKDSKGGSLFITNTSDKPLTIQMPKAFAAVHVMKQIGGVGGIIRAAAAARLGGQGGGGGQSVGGGGGFGGGGGGFGRRRWRRICFPCLPKKPRRSKSNRFASNMAKPNRVPK